MPTVRLKMCALYNPCTLLWNIYITGRWFLRNFVTVFFFPSPLQNNSVWTTVSVKQHAWNPSVVIKSPNSRYQVQGIDLTTGNVIVAEQFHKTGSGPTSLEVINICSVVLEWGSHLWSLNWTFLEGIPFFIFLKNKGQTNVPVICSYYLWIKGIFWDHHRPM